MLSTLLNKADEVVAIAEDPELIELRARVKTAAATHEALLKEEVRLKGIIADRGDHAGGMRATKNSMTRERACGLIRA